jgi:methionyl-tRNA formyltransferase
MKYIFFGTPRFAEIILSELINAGMPPIALVCNPDRPVGRKKIIMGPPTKVLATSYNERTNDSSAIEIFQPEKLDAAFIAQVGALEPDFFVVAAYGKILPRSILDIPRLGTLGVHPSLLPKLRGASPIQSAILIGEVKTGSTIYLMDEKTDHGPVLTQETLTDHNHTLSEINYLALETKLAELSARLLIKTIPNFFTGKIRPQPQDESQATFTKKFGAEDSFISPEDLAEAERGSTPKINEILRKINALNPEPGAWTTKDGQRIKLLKAAIQDKQLLFLEIQKEGEKPKRGTFSVL